MKTIAFLTLLTTHLALGQPKSDPSVAALGQPVSAELRFSPLLNAPVQQASLGSLKGKIVLLEFWATWCGACLQAIPHLTQLQRTQAGRLQVIAISQERPKRISQFLASRPAALWFASDTTGLLARQFPHQLIPHSVLIAPDGRLLGTTLPGSITDAVIDSVWQGMTVHLPQKIDQSQTYQQVLATQFYASDTVRSRFMMQAEIKGCPSLSTTYLTSPRFANRRVSCLNMPLSSLYSLAYGQFPYSRTVDKTGSARNAPVYCLDLITASPQLLLPTMQQELAKRFDIQARVESVAQPVSVLEIADTARFNRIPRNTSGKRTYYARHGEIDQAAITMADFAQFLESYGLNKELVVDQTHNGDKLDIKFSFQPENPQSLLLILQQMGLRLNKQERVIDKLVLYRL